MVIRRFIMTQTVAAVLLAIFVVFMAAIGVYTSKRSRTMDGFLLGSRNIGPWISAFAYGTSYFSAVIFIGYAGKTGWTVGIAGIWIGIFNALVGCLLAWFLLAKRTRLMSHHLKASTMPEFFAGRYNSKAMKIYAAIIIFVFLVPYSASVYKGLGYMFSQIFPIFGENGNTVCMLIIAVLTAVYLVLGGYVAAVITDFVQGIIMLVGVVVMVAIVIKNPIVGGFSEGMRKLSEIVPEGKSLVSLTGGNMLSFLSMNVILTSVGTWGLPQMIHKYYAINDEKDIPKAAVVSTVFALVIGIGAYLTGTFGRLYLNNALPDGGNYDAVVPTMLVTALSGNVFTNIVLGLILLLVLSASMSTLSSVVLTSSSAIVVDLLPTVKRNVNQKHQMILMRSICFVFIAVSFIIASMKIAFIMQLMSFSWGLVAGCFIGPYIWGLYSKKITKCGAWAGLLSGLLTVAGVSIFKMSSLGIKDGFTAAASISQDLGVIAMAISFVVTPLVSLFTKKIDTEYIDSVFSCIKK